MPSFTNPAFYSLLLQRKLSAMGGPRGLCPLENPIKIKKENPPSRAYEVTYTSMV